MVKSLFKGTRTVAMCAALGLATVQTGCSEEVVDDVADEATGGEELPQIALAPVDANYEWSAEEQMFVLGSAIDIMFHEGGHMVIDVFDIPIMGQEEDASDNFATLALLSMEDEFASAALLEGISGWYLLSAFDSGDMSAFFGQHDLGAQRASRKMCHLITAEPETYGSLAQEMELDEMATASCAQQFEEVATNWTRMLEDRNAFGESEYQITYAYGEATPELQPYRDLLEQAEMLEFVAQYLVDTLKLPREITVVTEACGEANAFYQSDTSQMTFCYEFAQELHTMWRLLDAEEEAGTEQAPEEAE